MGKTNHKRNSVRKVIEQSEAVLFLNSKNYKLNVHYEAYQAIDLANEIKRLDKAVKNSVSDLGKIIKKIKDHKNDIYGEMKFMLEANISIISSSLGSISAIS